MDNVSYNNPMHTEFLQRIIHDLHQEFIYDDWYDTLDTFYDIIAKEMHILKGLDVNIKCDKNSKVSETDLKYPTLRIEFEKFILHFSPKLEQGKIDRFHWYDITMCIIYKPTSSLLNNRPNDSVTLYHKANLVWLYKTGNAFKYEILVDGNVLNMSTFTNILINVVNNIDMKPDVFNNGYEENVPF